MRRIDLNYDLGENVGGHTLVDEEVLPLISSANIACGFHASDPVTMERTVRLANEHHVAIGAHPGLPDLVGVGRRLMNVDPVEVKAQIKYQVGALQAFTNAQGLHHVKPQGALYHMVAKNLELAIAICQGMQEIDPGLVLYGLAGSELIAAAEETGVPYAQETFVDRNIHNDGSLVLKTDKKAFITDEKRAAERVIQLIQNKIVESIDGKEVALDVDTFCIDGDNPNALDFVKFVRQALDEYAIRVQPI